VRVAISGAQRTGKTTLLEALARALGDHQAVEEPFYLLQAEGYDFAEMPALEDFERQLERSIELAMEDKPDRLFDRCPADMLAYLLTHDDAESFDAEAWLPGIDEAMGRLDFVVFCGIERPDRIAVSAVERGWRRRVDGELRDIVIGDRRDWGIPTLEVAGEPEQRVSQVLEALAASRRRAR